MNQELGRDVQAKTKYHHGDLRETLIDAVEQLVIEKGYENFSLADACRLAGVSTAAPYRHFEDREEILCAVLSRAYDRLSDRAVMVAKQQGVGTLESLIAVGKTYVAFAQEEQSLFRLMFGQKPELKTEPEVQEDCKECFAKVIQLVEFYCQQNNCQKDASQIAIQVWTFVHGAASLLIDEDYVAVAPHITADHVYRMIEESIPVFLKD